ncbi:hypothetical protein PQU92_08285 [Asticcacaulis sp. BYS171W]|uniref:Uncharacterized protein n=1 Tax=Asticcacaulis aquaticus TaxID=2984212 RepID=A0ABT5HTK6_9CAUL|nr:hypothetical protein [Asticcacaulis aquaticus]MDC7683272.1 hypothetical protein [Asticcacaulis aquaticus]
MKIKTGSYDSDAKTVDVTFTKGKVTHSRTIKACLTPRGAYDAAATQILIADLARGIAAKIEAGVIASPVRTPLTDGASGADFRARV